VTHLEYVWTGGTPSPTEHEYTGAVPYTFRADGTPLLDWYIKGNTVQNGTPSNPVDVNGVGVRTAQLWDISSWDGATAQRGTLERVTTGYKLTATSDNAYTMTYDNSAYSYPVTSEETYTLSWEVNNPNISGVIYIFTGANVADTPLTTVYTGSRSKTFTVPSGHNYMAFRLGVSTSGDSITYTNIMLNTGSTALPHEPYGYKIPISCGGTVNGVYIGANPLRKALDGTAVDELSSNGTLTQRVDADGSVLPVPVITQIDTPTIPTVNGSNTFDVDTTVKPSEIYIKYKGV
jgi:hypothetical protein